MTLSKLYNIIKERKETMQEGSYISDLFQRGENRIIQKVGEEAIETVIEAMAGNDERLLYEASDLVYHLIVLLSHKGMRIEDIARELKRRHK